MFVEKPEAWVAPSTNATFAGATYATRVLTKAMSVSIFVTALRAGKSENHIAKYSKLHVRNTTYVSTRLKNSGKKKLTGDVVRNDELRKRTGYEELHADGIV
jgi:hypothetical protein